MHMKSRTGLIFLAVFFVLSSSLFSQTGDWYYDKPIRSIVFEGLKSVKKTDLDGITAPFIGKLFTDELYVDLLNKIYALEYFETIEPRVFPYEQRQDAVTLNFTVIERPVVSSITFTGNKGLRTTEIKEAASLKEKDIFNETKLRLDERAIRDLYLKKGFTNIRVSARPEQTDAGVKVQFVINEGSPTVIKAINFEGNDVVSAKSLKDSMTLKEVGLFNKGAFQEATLELDKQAVLNYYHTRGYIDTELRDVIRSVATDPESGKDELTLTFIIREGVQYTYGGTTFTGNEIFTTEKLESLIKLKVGAVFNQTRYQEGVAAVADLYYENGYTSNYIGTDMEKDPEEKRVSFKITIVERPRSHIENIIIQGNTKTKEKVVLRELPLESGDIFSKTKMIAGLRNLYNLQFFSAVVPDVVPGSEENLVNLIINVEEQSTTSIEFGVTFSGMADPDAFPVSVFAKWQDSNVLGSGKSVSANATVSPDQQSVAIGYADNWLFGQPFTVGMNLEFIHANYVTLQNTFIPGSKDTSNFYMNYQQWKIAWDGYVGRRWYPLFAIVNWSGGLQISVLRNDYDPTIYSPFDDSLADYCNIWGLNNSIWTAASLDNRDINYDPSKGWFISQRVSWTGLLPGIEQDYFFRSDTKAELYFTLLDVPIKKWNLKFVLAGYSGLSFILPAQGKTVGYDSQLYIDGMFTGRGWKNLYNNPADRGLALWASYLELRMPIVPGIFSVDFFVDAVTTKRSLGDMFTKLSLGDMYFSFGPGLRFSIPQFPLRLMFANTFQVKNGQVKWGSNGNAKGPDWQFVLSFNIVNK